MNVIEVTSIFTIFAIILFIVMLIMNLENRQLKAKLLEKERNLYQLTSVTTNFLWHMNHSRLNIDKSMCDLLDTLYPNSTLQYKSAEKECIKNSLQPLIDYELSLKEELENAESK